jgi:signal peptidase
MPGQRETVEGLNENAGTSAARSHGRGGVADHGRNREAGKARDDVPSRAAPALELRSSALITAYLAGAYLLTQLVLARHVAPDLSFYVLQPLVWCGLGLIAYRASVGLPERPALSRPLIVLGVLAGLFQVSLMLMAGVLFGLGYSPYAREPLHIAQNLWYVMAMIAGLEMARSYLIAVWSRVSPLLGLLVVALLFAAVMVSTTQFEMVADGDRRFEIIGGTMLPGFAESLLATFLAAMGGPLMAIAYRGSLAAFEWVSPVLPNLPWAAKALFGALAPALALVFVRDAVRRWQEEPETEAEAAPEGIGFGWVFAMAVVAALIWLNTGLLGVKTALISGSSMKPYLAVGDVAITRNVSPEEIQVGDVIQYRLGGGAVLHRVVEIQGSGSSRVFITQGDSNDATDDPVIAQQVMGKVVLKIPEAGWVPITVQDAFKKLRQIL